MLTLDFRLDADDELLLIVAGRTIGKMKKSSSDEFVEEEKDKALEKLKSVIKIILTNHFVALLD